MLHFGENNPQELHEIKASGHSTESQHPSFISLCSPTLLMAVDFQSECFGLQFRMFLALCAKRDFKDCKRINPPLREERHREENFEAGRSVII